MKTIEESGKSAVDGHAAADAVNPNKSYLLAVGLSYCFGIFGVDRFYLGRVVTGIFKLLTLGGLGIWATIDLMLVGYGKVRAKQNETPLRGFAKYSDFIKVVALLLALQQILMMLAIAAALIITTLSGLAQREDNLTYNRAAYIADSLNAYTYGPTGVPQDLDEVLPGYEFSGITYNKLSDKSYSFCVDYKTAGKFRLAGGYDPEPRESGLIMPAKHKKGMNCQTITLALPTGERGGLVSPVTAEPSSDAQKACGVAGAPKTPLSGTMSKTLTGHSEDGVAEYILEKPSRGGGLVYRVTADTKVFNSICIPIDHSNVYGNDSVDVFADPAHLSGIVGEPSDALVVIDNTSHVNN